MAVDDSEDSLEATKWVLKNMYQEGALLGNGTAGEPFLKSALLSLATAGDRVHLLHVVPCLPNNPLVHSSSYLISPLMDEEIELDVAAEVSVMS